MKRFLAVLGMVALALAGCNFSTSARDTIATSFGYITWAQSEYGTQCKANPGIQPCTTVTHAIGLHNAAVDSLDAYCGGIPAAGQQSWASGGPCAPVKGMQGALQAALTNLSPVIADLRLLATGRSQPKATLMPKADLMRDKPDVRASLLSVRLEGAL